MIYFTADLHFGHGNIIRYCGRPFGSVEEMDQRITDNFKERLGADDDLYILGDVTLNQSVARVRNYLKDIPGRKHLIFGNHDERLRRHQKEIDDIFVECADMKVLEVEDADLGSVNFMLCHYPLLHWGYNEDGQGIHLFGHIHNNPAQNQVMSHVPHCLNVGVDLWDFRPLSVNEVLSEIRTHDAAISKSLDELCSS